MTDAEEYYDSAVEPTKSPTDGHSSGRAPQPPVLAHSRLPIFRLPIEILSDIFSYLPHFHVGPAASPTLAPAWVAILHVCRWWREVASACKTLWTTVPLGGPEWTEFALERSKPRLLTIEIASKGGDENEDEDDIDERVAAASRTAAGAVSRARQVILKDLNHSGPFLKSTTPSLFFRGIHDTLARERAPELSSLECKDQSLLREDFFLEAPPRLRRVVLYACTVNLDCHLFRAPLTSLSLRACVITGHSSELLDMLRRLPTLEHLTLSEVFAVFRVPRYDGPVVHLPRLTHLNLRADLALLSEIVTSLTFPTLAHTTLDCFKPRSAFGAIVTFRYILSHHLRHAIASPERADHRIEVNRFDDNVLITLCPEPSKSSSSSQASSSPPSSPISYLRIALHWKETEDVPQPTVSELLAVLPAFGDFTHLSVSTTPSCACTPSEWKILYTLFPSLETLGAMDAAPSSLLRALTSARPPMPLFPSLRTVSLCLVDFSDPDKASLFEDLVEVMEDVERYPGKRGNGLAVVFAECTFAPEMLERMKGYEDMGRAAW